MEIPILNNKMRKLLLLLIIIGLLPLTLSAGDNWVIHASDGVSKINGTDVCVDIYGSQKCLSEVGTGGGDIAGVIAGDGLTGGGLSGEVTLDVFADTCGAGDFSSYNGTGFECDTPAGGTVYNDLFNFTNGPGYYNSTNFDIADYYLLNNPFGYYNSTNPSPDTTYDAGSNLTLTSTTFSLNTAGVLEWLKNIFWDISTALFTDQNITTTGNITASYFFGDGSELTNLPAGTEVDPMWTSNQTAFNDTWNAYVNENSSITHIGDCPSGQFAQNLTKDGPECAAPSGSGDITAVTTDGPYLTGGTENGDADLLIDTGALNDTIFANSLNQTEADAIYITLATEGDLNVNSSNYWDSYDTANTTWFEDIAGALSLKLSELTSWVDTWIGTKTTDDLAQGSTNLYDNRSWNQTFADTLYADISVTGDDASWNKTYADTLYAILGYGDDWNKTYADTIYQPIGTYLTSSEILAQFGNFSAWDYFTGIPTATPSDGDTTHLSTADQIYDWIIGLGYSTTDGTVTSVSAGDGLDFTSITSTGSVTLGTPSTLTSSTTNAVTTTSHTHEVDESGFSIGASQITAGTFGTGNYVMDTNLTVERVVFENNAQHYINDSADCIIIVGSTSVIEVC